MQTFTCGICKKEWDYEGIIPSVVQYGFINLQGQDDELIAFYCLGVGCEALIVHRAKRGFSKKFHISLTYELDVAGLDTDVYKFWYFSSMPFSQISSGTLKSFDVDEDRYQMWEIKAGCLPILKTLTGLEFYCSFNSDFPLAFTNDVRMLTCKKETLDFLLAIEINSKQRLFPRYLIGDQLFKSLDFFFGQYTNTEDSLIEFSLSNIGLMDGKVETRQTVYFDPAAFYQVLIADVENPPELRYITPDRELRDKLIKHDQMLEAIKEPFLKGQLHERLSSLADEFVQEYINDFQQFKFSHDSVWDFKERYLVKIYKEWKAGSLIKKKPRKLTPSQSAKLSCRAVAEEIWNRDSSITIAEMSERRELKDASDNSYEQRTIYKWIRDLAPNRKPGRRSKK